MTKFQRAPQSEVQSVAWRTPAEVLFRRRGGVSGGSPACASVLPISSGFRVEFVKRGVSSVGCVGPVRCVGSVSVSGPVAYRLHPVASEYGQSPQGPKSMFLRMLWQSRRATAAVQFERMQQRLAGRADREIVRQSCVGSVASVACSPVASRASQSSPSSSPSTRRSRPVQSVSCIGGVPDALVSVASRVQSKIAESLSEMSKIASVAFRASVQSAVTVASPVSVASGVPVASRETVQSGPSLSRERSVAPVGSIQSSTGEFVQVGAALSSVLSRVRAVAEASAEMQSVTREGKSRMH